MNAASRLWVAGAALCFSSGCSFLFVKAPPEQPPVRGERVRCTESKVAPVLDTIGLTFQGFRTVVAVSSNEGDYQGAPISRDADIGFGILFAGLHAASAVYGYGAVSRCADSHALSDASSNADDLPPPPRRPVPPATAHRSAACGDDFDCKSDRVCENGVCVPSRATSTEPPAEKPHAEDKPMSDAEKASLAVWFDSIYEQEATDWAWARRTERALRKHMQDHGAEVVSAFTCKATVCRGVYRFASPTVRQETWQSLTLPFEHDKLFVGGAASSAATEDTFYLRKRVDEPSL